MCATALVFTGIGTAATPAGAVPAPAVGHEALYESPGTFNWQVPARVTTVRVETVGASGGDAMTRFEPSEGGLGGSTAATIAVTPGETIQVNVGGAGTAGRRGPGDGAGGYNGGGNAVWAGCEIGGSGGGASDVRRGGTALAHRVVVAGGGGGAGTAMHFGVDENAGGHGGGDAPTAGSSGFGNHGGGAGTEDAGGAGGTDGHDQGLDGSFGQGAANVTDTCMSSGAGGGGWYGGGSGSSDGPMANGGGGGGSGYVAPGATSIVYGNGVNDGNGSVRITWTQPPAPTPTPKPKPKPTPHPTPKPKPTPAPSPPPAPRCPDPAAPLRVFPNRPSILLAAYLMQNCDYSARGLIAAGMPVTALDPPHSSVCPAWRPFRVFANRPSLIVSAFLVGNCGYRIHWQFQTMRLTPYVVPHGWTPGARVSL